MFRIPHHFLTAAFFAASLCAQQVDVAVSKDPAGPAGQGTLVTFTVTYVNGIGDGLKDFHICPAGRPQGVPQANGGLDPTHSGDDWVTSKSSNYYHWGVANSSYQGLTTGQSLTFQILYPTVHPDDFDTQAKPIRRWEATKDGKMRKPPQSSIIDKELSSNTGAPVKLVSHDDGVRLVTAAPTDYFLFGTTVGIEVHAPADVGSPYLIAGAFGTNPGTNFGWLHIPLNPDPMLQLTLTPNQFCVGFQGTIPPSGVADAQVILPPYPFLNGLEFNLAAMVIDPFVMLPYDVSDPMFVRIE